MSPSKYDRRRSSVVSFDAPTWEAPTVVVLDTNVAAEALLPNEPEHEACGMVLRRLADAGTLVVFNRLLELELWEVVFNQALRLDLPRNQIRHGRFTPEGRAQASSVLSRAERDWADVLDRLHWQCIEVEDVADAVPDIMRSYGLQSYDAVHAATLLASGATDIVTRDAGFAALLPEDATLHTTMRRLAPTRARRRVASTVGAG